MGYAAQPIGPQEAAFLTTPGLSIVAASRGPDNIPAVARSLGCRLSPDLRQITLFFPVPEAHELLAHVGSNGVIATIFSLPSTHEAMQLKGTDAVAGKPLQTDFEPVDSYRKAFVNHVKKLGFSVPAIEALLSCARDDLATVTFTPSAAFSQTPGPNAGHALGPTK